LNRGDFIGMMSNTVEMDRGMINEVKDLIELFPYFQSAHMLLLKGLHNTEDVKFKNQLNQSALFIADREVLYYLLNRKPETANEHSAVSLQQDINMPEDIADHQQVVLESGMSSADLIAELDGNDLLSSGEENEDDTITAGTEPQVIATDSLTDESASVVLVLDDGEHHVEETFVYMDPTFLVQGNEDLLELDLSEKEAEAAGYDSPSEDTADTEQKEQGKVSQADLIDRFILTNPRISPVREKSDTPVEDISKPYVEDTGGLVTETLARIYVTQGYYSRAIDIYERLSLKYPEKSSYFATQIEKVKELIK
jgi:hypothetical protein